MTKSKWNKIKELKSSADDIFEGNLEKTSLCKEKFEDFTKSEFVTKSSRIYNLWRIGVFAILILIFYVMVKYVSKQDFIENSEIKIRTETFTVLLFLLSCIRPVYFIIRNAQLIKIDNKGIQILNDLIPWADIKGTYIEKRYYEDSYDYFLLIKTKNRNCRSSIADGKENRQYISHVVETFRLKYGSAQ